MKYLITLAIALSLAGCEKARNTVDDQIHDYSICKNAGMSAYLNGYGEVRCSP